MPNDDDMKGMSHKDYLEEMEYRKEQAARAKGRLCAICGEVIPFDVATPDGMLCAYHQNQMAKDD